MLNLIGKAVAGVILTREARDAVRDVGGLASAIQASADARILKAAGMPLPPLGARIGATALTSPRTWTVPAGAPLTMRPPTPEPAAARTAAPPPVTPNSTRPNAAPTGAKAERIEPAPPAIPPARDFLTPERAALIQNAMKVHSAKQTILAHLSDEQRAKLNEIAMKTMFPQNAD
jgi:hypothetical protein